VGNALPLSKIPLGTVIHNIELKEGKGGQMVRSAGAGAQLMAREGDWARFRLPSGEMRKVHVRCYATIGQVGNLEHENVSIGKAGRTRHLGKKPHNRGVSMNPVDTRSAAARARPRAAVTRSARGASRPRATRRAATSRRTSSSSSGEPSNALTEKGAFVDDHLDEEGGGDEPRARQEGHQDWSRRSTVHSRHGRPHNRGSQRRKFIPVYISENMVVTSSASCADPTFKGHSGKKVRRRQAAGAGVAETVNDGSNGNSEDT
jgi:hypothetical protein